MRMCKNLAETETKAWAGWPSLKALIKKVIMLIVTKQNKARNWKMQKNMKNTEIIHITHSPTGPDRLINVNIVNYFLLFPFCIAETLIYTVLCTYVTFWEILDPNVLSFTKEGWDKQKSRPCFWVGTLHSIKMLDH